MSETTHTAIDTAYPGNLFMVVAPSGAGKSTLVNALLAQDKAIRLSISHTTRRPRPGEQNGREYHFITTEEFRVARDRGDFLEWAEVHGNYYATSRVWIEEQMAQGTDVLLEIDWQGAAQVRKVFPQAISVFILPPSQAELEKRLRGRGTDSAETIARRLDAACTEMRQVDQFDYVIINNELQVAIEELCTLVRAARLRTPVVRARKPACFLPVD